MCSLGKTLLPFDLLHSVLQVQICLLLQVFLDFLVCIQDPYDEKEMFFWVLVLKGPVDLHRTVQIQLLQYCISDSFVDHDGYSISSKGFLSTIVDIMVI